MNASLENISLVDFIKELNAKEILESEYPKRIKRFLALKARELKIPLFGTFELTPLCNLNCKMCYVHLNPTISDSYNLLSLKQWQNIIKQAYDCGMRVATLTGGECLTYPYFDEVYMFLQSKGVGINILSNGLLMDEKRISFLKAAPPNSIQITLYGSNNDEYEAVTGVRAFDQVSDNLKLLKQSNIPVRIAITPNRFMNKDINRLLDVVEQFEIPYFLSANLIQARSNTDRHVEMFPIDDYIEWRRITNERNHVLTEPIDPVELPDYNRKAHNSYGLLCGGGKCSFCIRNDGQMCTCVSLSDYSIDVLDKPFIEAWKDINNYAEHYPIPQECNGCSYQSICSPCPATHLNASVGHCDSMICERTYRSVQAGLLQLPAKFK